MAINSIQDLFDNLLKSTAPSEVEKILVDIGDISDIGLNKPFGKLNLQWVPYGGKTSNYSTIGLASKPGRSITERLTNAIDAVLEGHSLNVSKVPFSPQEAVSDWFGRPVSTATTGLFTWKYAQGGFDRKVGIVLNNSGNEEAPTVDVIDLGIGIRAEDFSSTILSLQEGNKIKKKYLVGSFGQGGSSTLAFCDYVLIISRHVDSPKQVSFTVVKESFLGDDYKENCYSYLTVTTESGKQAVPSFEMDGAIGLYTSFDSLRISELTVGTLVRHYSFRLTNISKAIGPREGNLYHYLHYSLFDPLIPFQIIDLRKAGEKVKQEISTGSRNRLMKLIGKMDDEIDSSNSECKLYRPFTYIRPYGADNPCIKIEYWVIFNNEKKTDKKTGEEKWELRNESNSLYIQRKHPAVITLNGQNQGELTASQVFKELGLDSVSKHIVIHIDATEAPGNVKKLLFTTNREILRDGDVLESIKQELRAILKEDESLAAIEKDLEAKAISKVTASTDDEVKKKITALLREIGFTPSAEGTDVRQGDGIDTEDPKPEPPDGPVDPKPHIPIVTLPYPEVSRFEIVKPKGELKLHLNRTAMVLVETDADVKYRDEIRIKIDPEALMTSSYSPLDGGRVKWRLRALEHAKIGDMGKISVTLTKSNGDQLRDEIAYEIIEPVEKPAKEVKGFIPDFEVIPISPGDDNWKDVWEDIPEDSDDATSVAYIPKRIGEKTIVYYSTAFAPYRTVFEKLKNANDPLYMFFETNYKVWIGYHAILQFSTKTDTEDQDLENKLLAEREKERSLVAQMQVKQAYSSAELMMKIQKQKAVTE